ncbi:BtrH N-terminal domain-containing protein [Neotamlana laminarinivorans]|uniref:BtrH N-terminal domain-containing protein n=1 Tax=Neotamlana laminarinivorans TaxID=2883124 RepID=A0A9X1I353_9FLAO|nr:BtrH N-terminal domain-containing protein [Tamlana laminarinivorans]MCB4799492.1 BtrH N-terminal domain-containing protein [Tamlana laminarinivorans]
MKIDFKHHQSAHCENGVVSNLMKHNGINISEPMIFGIGSGLIYCYIPFLKVNHGPAVTYRVMPGLIFKRFAKRIGVTFKREKFKSATKAKQRLDDNIKNNNPVGLQVGIYHLLYLPDHYRFHFNAHNIVVYGKEGSDYLVSDPVIENVAKLDEKQLEKARFAKGPFAPNGQIYYPISFPKESEIPYKKAIVKGIKQTCRDMLAPIPIVGVKGIRMVAKLIKKWPKKKGIKVANHYLGQIVRMQEEIGTGGGGFRYIFAAFLQESSAILNNEKLMELSKEMTVIGDLWRDFALEASRLYKNRKATTGSYDKVSEMLFELADKEEVFFKALKIAIK